MADPVPTAPRAVPQLAPVEFDPFADPASGSDAGRLLPLTAMQRELVAAVQMGDESNAAFNLVYGLHLEGDLAPASMARALEQVVRRHGALRLQVTQDRSAQRVLPALATELPLLSLPGLDEAGREQALAALLDEEAATPFDIHRAPLWRARLVSFDAHRHVLVLAIHHLASDGWSSSVLFGDLGRAYAADRFGVAPSWPPAFGYEDFVARFTSDEHRAREAADLAWWRDRHTPPAAPLELPADRPRPAQKTWRCQHTRTALDESLTTAVRSLGARHGCTVFVTLLAAFQGLLARLTGSADLVVGVPIAVQTGLENAHVIADGANTVALRTAIDVDAPFTEQLVAVRRAFLDAQAHPWTSFGNLVPELRLPRDPSRTPLVDVLFNIDRSGAPFDFGELRLVRLDTPRHGSNAEWSLNVIDDGRALAVECHTLQARVEPQTARRWLDAYVQGLRRLVADPSLPLALAFAPDGEDRAFLDAVNATTQPYPKTQRLEQRLREQAAQTPHAPAVWFDGQAWSYAELDARSDGIAAALRAQGVVPGERVGIHAGRHAHLVAAVFGVLKAGAAYVPLDPAYPSERLRFMIEDARLRVVLCDEASAGHEAVAACRRVAMERCTPQQDAPLSELSSAAAAYVIYTSGSTGRPKGVVVPHAAVMNYLHSLARDPGLVAADRMAAVTTLSFDMSVPELLLPMIAGASVVMISRDEVRHGAALARRLADSGVTVLQAAPSIWRLLLDAGWTGAPSLKAFSGGEPLMPDLAKALLERCAGVWNLYGPTETTVFSAMWRVRSPERGIRVGTPVANTQLHVLDGRLRPVPIGAIGEICIGGDGVALGYLDRPELTAERFVPDPARPGGRLYRTGDRGRWAADGTLECLGRQDDQVKLRGHRIELGEIEHVLLGCPGVRRAMVAVDRTAGSEPRLVAAVVGELGAAQARGLREACRVHLPDYMVPAVVVALPELPTLPNGKLDRGLLPARVRDAALLQPVAVPEADVALALSAEEAAVAAIWRRHLGVPRILPTDNFFDLGGHSLLAARVSAEIEAALGHPVGVPRLVMESLSQVARRPSGPVAAPRLPDSRAQGWLQRWSQAFRRGD